MAQSSGDVIEGFLCPVCMQNLITQAQLLTHFQERHEDEQDVLKSLKELFGKAKKKIGLVQEEDGNYKFGSNLTSLKHQQASFTTEEQELGATRSHTERFKLIRNTRVEQYCTETNKLIIRLDKLLVDVPSDPSKRKAHEQNIVCWVEGTHVNLCPSCARSFHVARRKHHCRLCGAIMCHDCSCFLSIMDARRMVAATSLDDFMGSAVKKSGSTQSLNNSSSEADFRLCQPCYQRLTRREQLKESRMSRPIISQFYEKLQSHRHEASNLLTEYHKLCFSLCSGETFYHLSDAQQVRIKLIKLAEAIDNTSKAILVLGTKGGDSSVPQGRAMRLQQAIRSSATIFLRDKLVGLPSLPTEAQLKLLQEKHQIAIENSLRNNTPVTTAVASSRPPEVMANAGWTPENSSKLFFDTDNVMVQQMNNIKNYIKQAREAHKYDVVKTLEANLKDLQEEYWKQQNQCQ